MRIIRTHALLACTLLALSSGASLSAQSAVARHQAQTTQPAPPPNAPVEAQTDAPPVVEIPRGVVRIAQGYTLPANHSIPYIQTVFGDVTIDGRVDRDVVVNLGSARLGKTAVIEGSLVVIGGSATIEEGASVRSDLVVIGGTLTSAPGFSPYGEHVVIGSQWFGDALRDLLPWVTQGLLLGRPIVPGLDWVWLVVGIFFLIYLTINLVFDRAVSAAADAIAERPLSTFVTGLLVLLLTVPVLAIIAASVIGLVIVPFLLCAVVIAALVGKTAVARAIGRGVTRPTLPEGRLAALVAFLIGFAFLTLAYMVPVLGVLVWALTSVVGLGAASMTFRAFIRRERQAAAPVPTDPVVPVAAMAPTAPVASTPRLDGAAAAAPLHVPPAVVAAPEGTADAPPAPSAFNQGLAAYPRAAFLDRVAAFALDCILVGVLNAWLDVGRDDGFYFVLLLVYHIAFWTWKGTTLGGIICSVKVVRTHGAELRPVDAVVRGLSSVFSIVALGIGCLWMLQDPERQMWHDKIAGTLVVKVPREMVLP